MAQTKSSIEGVNTFYNKRLRRVLNETLRIVPLGQKAPLPKGEGKTMEWFEWNKLNVTLTSGVVDAAIATEGTDPTAKSLTGLARSVSLTEYGDYSEVTRLLKNTHIDKQVKGVSALYGAYAAEVLDLVTQQAIVSGGCMPVRADLDATYEWSGTFTTVTTIASMADTTFDATAFGGTDDDANMAVMYITSGTGRGTGGVITDYTASSGTFTVDGLDVKPAVGDAYTVVTPATLAFDTASNADSLNTGAIRRGMRLLKTYDAMPYDSDGFFMGVLSPESEEGLMNDTNWTNVSQYSAQVEGKGGGLFKGEVGKWGGVRWVRTTKPFKFPITLDPAVNGLTKGVGTDGINYSAASYENELGVTCSFIFGKDSFGVVDFDGFDGSGSAPRIITKTPGAGDTSNPLNMRSTVGFYAAYATRVLQPLNMVQIWSAEKQL